MILQRSHTSFLELLQASWHRLVRLLATLLALAPWALVLADARAPALLACAPLALDADGYDFPMQFWVQAAAAGLCITELPVRLIYNDPNRTFGGPLDQADARRRHYLDTLHGELRSCADQLPPTAVAGLVDAAPKT